MRTLDVLPTISRGHLQRGLRLQAVAIAGRRRCVLFVHVRLTKYRHSFNFNPTFPREHARLLQTVNQCQQCLSRLEVVLTVTRACKSGSSMLGGGHCQWEKGFLGCTKNSFIFKYWEKYHHRFAT